MTKSIAGSSTATVVGHLVGIAIMCRHYWYPNNHLRFSVNATRYTLMIVYKLYAHHRMALFISFALSLTVIPVLWVFSRVAPEALWYSYLVAYAIEAVAIVVLHKAMHLRFTLPTTV